MADDGFRYELETPEGVLKHLGGGGGTEHGRGGEAFDDALVKILPGAAVVSFALAVFEGGEEEGIGAFVEPLVILVILVLNAIVAENARVMRDGEMVTLPARELVPVTWWRSVWATSAAASASAMKTTAIQNIIQAKTNMLFAATVVVNGLGHGVVTEVGMKTEIGKIQQSVQDASKEEEDTPLTKKLDEFGELLSKVIAVICIVVWIINYKNFFDPIYGSVFKGCIYYFKIAVALAVAAIPEGLPAVITTCLALGTRKMAKKNAIVRKLPSVETLGCTTVICSETEPVHSLRTRRVCDVHASASRRRLVTYDVEGHTYAPRGKIEGAPLGQFKAVDSLATVCSLCNESAIEYRAVNCKYRRREAGRDAVAACVNPEKAVQFCDGISGGSEQEAGAWSSRACKVHVSVCTKSPQCFFSQRATRSSAPECFCLSKAEGLTDRFWVTSLQPESEGGWLGAHVETIYQETVYRPRSRLGVLRTLQPSSRA
ncbi:E1-E2 ATPase [Phytophthora infestans]|uniref:E1-E2 ATPase n=1 Tax=Phytophthora infestans TaxID=4787 RepID=A0A833VUZ4_PHYIN|nr:E1-E2 ATPase [Phytophthora infestans]